jgi:hypothetical protein
MKILSEIYHEDVSSKQEKFGVIILWILIMALTVVFLKPSLVSSFIHLPSITLYEVLILAILIACGIYATCLYSLTISITVEGLKLSFGPFHHFIRCGKNVDAEHNNKAALRQYRYGVSLTYYYGINSGYREGERILVYNVSVKDIILLKLKDNKYRYISFSTKNPEKVLRLLSRNTNFSSSQN